MKRIVLFLLVIAAITNICNAQSYELKNLDGTYACRYNMYSGTERYVVESLTVYERIAGCVYVVCVKLYNVKESIYVGIPNDTTRIEFTERLGKYTLKDGTGYDLIDSDENWKIEVRPNKAYSHISLEGRIKDNNYRYYFTVNLTSEEFEKCRIDEKVRN